jgi:carboxylesterase
VLASSTAADEPSGTGQNGAMTSAANGSTSAELLPDAEPLAVPARPELTGGQRIGVLLSHGFTGQPASMKPWARALADQGYGVIVPRLPGHGTRWQDLNKTTYDEWYAEASRAFEELAANHDVLVVAGLSMGGSLVLRLAEEHADKIAGIMLVNPAVATKRLDVKLLPVLKHIVPAFPGIASDIKKPGTNEYGYSRTPLKAAHSMMVGWRKVVADLGKVTAPLIYFHSREDHVVDELSETVIVEGVSSSDVEVVILEDSYHVATLDNDLPLIIEDSLKFLARVTVAPAS